jgi:hypothetical protein
MHHLEVGMDRIGWMSLAMSLAVVSTCSSKAVALTRNFFRKGSEYWNSQYKELTLRLAAVETKPTLVLDATTY